MMINPWTKLPLLLAMLWATCSLAASGRVVLAHNEALIEQAGQWQPAQSGSDIAAEALRTGISGRLQLRLADGTLIALPPNSEVRWSDGTGVSLTQGGLRLSTPSPETYHTVQALGRTLRVSGYLKLQMCTTGCTLAPGLYGRSSAGETIVEYEGGRSVLKGKVFRLSPTATRPEILAKAPALLDDISRRLVKGVEAFRAGNYPEAQKYLEAVANDNPSETVVSYYLGLIALESQNNAQALKLLQKYMKEDPQAALEREVPKTITLLSTSQLQEEVANAMAEEKSLTQAKPEPNSIAVQTFASRGDPLYRPDPGSRPESAGA
jgi:tetratricopeptide (TPR) repeat protein